MNQDQGCPRDIVIRLDPGPDMREQAQAIAPVIAQIIGLREPSTLSAQYAQGVDGRTTGISYGRYFDGVPIWHGDVLIDLGDDGRIVEASSLVAEPIELSTAVPSLP